jgi:hypothetical protein
MMMKMKVLKMITIVVMRETESFNNDLHQDQAIAITIIMRMTAFDFFEKIVKDLNRYIENLLSIKIILTVFRIWNSIHLYK